MIDYSAAIGAGVQRWMDANGDRILEVIAAILEKAGDNAAQLIAASIMMKVGKFLDDNRAEIVTASAAAIASAYHSRMHPAQKKEGA